MQQRPARLSPADSWPDWLSGTHLQAELGQLRICVIHPGDEEGGLLVQRLQRLGCQVQALWPPRPVLPQGTDAVFLALKAEIPAHALAWARSEPVPAIIALADAENLHTLSTLLALEVRAVLPARAGYFGLLSSLLLACRAQGQARRQQQLLTKLQAKLQGQRRLAQAKKILMRAQQIDEDQAYARIREQAMRRRCTVEDMAEVIVSASELLSPSPQEITQPCAQAGPGLNAPP